MKRTCKKRFAVALVPIAALIASSPAGAGEVIVRDGLIIEKAWARAMPPGAQTAAAYLIINNRSDFRAQLEAVATPIARSASLHRTELEDGISRMRPLESGAALPPNSELVMQPGGVHVMLTGLQEPLQSGTRLPLVLTFADGSTASIQAEVRGIGATAEDHHHEDS